jgi:hypothetical protein
VVFSCEWRRIIEETVVSPFYGLCEIFEKMTAIYGVLIFQKQPYMVLKQNWRNYSNKIEGNCQQNGG